MKAKVLGADGKNLETKLNDWLSENAGVKVHNIVMTCAEGWFTAVVFYEEPPKEGITDLSF